ncbi:MAG: hypothetical protein RIQ60_145 [Pseudomonadota bacterium]|jgi:uncharacterized protein YceH (UPF0502 family)
MSLPILTPLQARIVAVLVEKAATVPDTYPMSVNALVGGCNQKTARDPVMNVGEAEVLLELDALKALNLVFQQSGSRVARYEHNMARVLGIPGAAVALLATLILRGPQTAAELRTHCERLHRFADISSVEGFLEELAEKTPARVVKLARAPGAREARWAHLLCGEVLQARWEDAPTGAAAAAVAAAQGFDLGDLLAMRAELARQAAEINELRALVQRMATELGLS